MSDVLLQALTNTDIDWMVTTGERHSLENGMALNTLGDSSEAATSGATNSTTFTESIHLLLEGQLAMSAPCSNKEFLCLSRGAMIGTDCLFSLQSAAVVTAKGKATVLSITKPQLQEKIKSDVDFAAHFYRAIALIMSERIRRQF